MRTRAPPVNVLIHPMTSSKLETLGSNILLGGNGLPALEFTNITNLNLLNLLPCNGLVKESPHI